MLLLRPDLLLPDDFAGVSPESALAEDLPLLEGVDFDAVEVVLTAAVRLKISAVELALLEADDFAPLEED